MEETLSFLSIEDRLFYCEKSIPVASCCLLARFQALFGVLILSLSLYPPL